MIDLKHMDIGSRNQRLRETLEGFGLFVHPVPKEDDPDTIDYLCVSVVMPDDLSKQRLSQSSTIGSVATPMSGTQVAEDIGTTETDGFNVVNFPSISR